jgi:hypothetical protein
VLSTLIACVDEERPPGEPSDEEIQELADLMCETSEICWSTDVDKAKIEACKARQAGLPDRLYGKDNAECADVWLPFEYRDCWAHLGCEDREMAGSAPGTPCWEEAKAAYDAGCTL